ncbi:MAG: bifunctional diaminohydroxyphosphoribosylaminopyrimidine deaminase/5-amino-6-(5-phosphoribosylamino)uracil reductase RibD [Thermodesulfovibrionales bacterium]|nr:bifunctional diaminohydroxyphosphoribosylaminopyrimidine deaminase/5-amino-6-(5-phosphoribosylamino)uracil reductase RibD [Thermodesulfovibrionales bacterium]
MVKSEIANFSEHDIGFMQRSLKLALKAQGMTSPNPMVGAVIVRNNKIVGEGFHRKPGTPHAEVIAIEEAGDKTRGASLYVNLEPCCHTDKRTPPCTEAIINSGIKQVFVAMIDPNPKVSGRGIDVLRSHGIDVRVGILEDKAKKLNEVYIKYITTKKPFVILKLATTLDGKIATHKGDSKWITGQKARILVHKIRNSVDAVMVAVGTVMADNPQLTVRLYKRKFIKNPIRVIIDPNLEIPTNYNVFNIPPPTILVTKEESLLRDSSVLLEKRKLLIERGVKFISYKGDKVDLNWLMGRLGEEGITSIMVEGGSSFSASCLNYGIVDKAIFFIAPKILGGKESITAVGGENLRDLDNAFILKNLKIKMVGGDIMVEGYIIKEF